MKTFSTFLDLVNTYLQDGEVRGRFYWALLWKTCACRNPVPTAFETHRQTDQYCLWGEQSKETDEHTLWHRAELCFTKLTVFCTYLSLMFWQIFITNIWHIFITNVLHTYLSCFGTYLSLMFWHIFITNVLAHIISLVRAHVTNVLAHI